MRSIGLVIWLCVTGTVAAQPRIPSSTEIRAGYCAAVLGDYLVTAEDTVRQFAGTGLAARGDEKYAALVRQRDEIRVRLARATATSHAKGIDSATIEAAAARARRDLEQREAVMESCKAACTSQSGAIICYVKCADEVANSQAGRRTQSCLED